MPAWTLLPLARTLRESLSSPGLAQTFRAPVVENSGPPKHKDLSFGVQRDLKGGFHKTLSRRRTVPSQLAFASGGCYVVIVPNGWGQGIRFLHWAVTRPWAKLFCGLVMLVLLKLACLRR